MLKSKLRKKLLKRRKIKFSPKLKIKYATISKFLKKNKIVGGYFPVNYEIDCIEILHKLEKNNFKISLPKIKDNNKMEFYKYSFKEPLKINKYGIPEPLSKKILYPDYILVPLVAFDKKLYRLGYGGGYYDRYLEKINKKKNFLSIGLAFSFQNINKIPREIFDKKLDLIITERSIYK